MFNHALVQTLKFSGARYAAGRTRCGRQRHNFEGRQVESEFCCHTFLL